MMGALRSMNPKDFNIGLYDSSNGKPLKAKVAFEIDDASCRVVLLFTQAKRGDIVQIIHPYPGENYGMSSHFHIAEIDKDWIDHWAALSGISPAALINHIASGQKSLTGDQR